MKMQEYSPDYLYFRIEKMRIIMKYKVSNGFTLIEIGIVLFVVGILVALILPSFTQGIKDNARAKEMYTVAIKTFDAIKSIASSCNLPMQSVIGSTGTSTLYAGGPFTPNGAQILLSKGKDQVVSQYQYCYEQANVNLISFPSYPNLSIELGSVSTGNQPYIIFRFPPNQDLLKATVKAVGLNESSYSCSAFGSSSGNSSIEFKGGLSINPIPNYCSVMFTAKLNN